MTQQPTADDHRREVRLDHERAAQRLHYNHGLDRAGAEATVALCERQAEQALLGEAAPDRLAPAARLFHVFLARIEIIGVAEQPIDAFLEKPLLLRQIEIHFCFLDYKSL